MHCEVVSYTFLESSNPIFDMFYENPRGLAPGNGHDFGDSSTRSQASLGLSR